MPPKKEAPKKQEILKDESGIPKNDVSFKFNFEIKQENIQNYALYFEWFGGNGEVTDRYEGGLFETWAPKSAEDKTVLAFEKVFDPLRVDDAFANTITSKEFYIYFVNTDEAKIIDSLMLDYSCLLSAMEEKPTFSFQTKTLKILEIERFSITITADKNLLQPLYRHYLNPMEVEVIGAKNIPMPSAEKYEPVYIKYTFFDGRSVKTNRVPRGNTLRWNFKHTFLVGLLDQTKFKETLQSKMLEFELHDRDEVINDNIKEDVVIIDLQQVFKEENERKAQEEAERLAQEQAAADAKKGAAGKKPQQAPAKQQAAPAKAQAGAADKKKDQKKKEVKLTDLIPQDVRKEKINDTIYGVSSFLLTDMLKPTVHSIKLRANVHPNKKYEDLESNNLDLNTTAKRNLQNALNSSSYMDLGCDLVIGIRLEYPLGSFKKPEPVSEEVSSKALPQGNAAQPASKTAAIPHSTANEKKRASISNKGQEQKKDPLAEKMNLLNESPIYERAIIITPYKCYDYVPKLIKSIQTINMEMLEKIGRSEGGLRALTTYAFSEADKKNKELDYIGGFQIIDNEYRVILVEGLSEGGMRRLEEECPRTEPNNEKMKILKNKEIKFKERLYAEFNLDIKKIRLRNDLSKILMNPSIYIRSKVPQAIQDTLIQISELRKAWNVNDAVSFNLFPSAENLITVERKYSEALTMEDINGYETEKRVIKRQNKLDNMKDSELKTTTGTVNMEKSLAFSNINKGLENESTAADELANNKLSPSKSSGSPGGPSRTKHGLLHMPKLKRCPQKANQYKIRMQIDPNAGDGELNVYSNQKNNTYMTQMKDLREKIRNDKQNFYTYSEKYLSLSIDPYEYEEQLRAEEKKRDAVPDGKKAFETIPFRNSKKKREHPKKLPYTAVEELSRETWLDHHTLKETLSKPTRGLPLNVNGKPEFQNHFTKMEFFSSPEAMDAEKRTALEVENEKKETKKKEYEDWSSKLKGTKYFYTHNVNQEQKAQTDKNKGLLHDSAVKKGFLLPNSMLKTAKIDMKRRVEDLPSSIYSLEPWNQEIAQGQKGIFRKPGHGDPVKAIGGVDFEIYTKHDIKYDDCIHKPLKESAFDNKILC